MAPEQTSRRILDRWYIAFFAMLLTLPTLYTLGGFKKDTAINEFRVLAEFPGFTSDAAILRQFCQDLEKYYNDHLGGREWLIDCRILVQRSLSPGFSNKVIGGKNGWLFYYTGKMFENHLGVPPLSEHKLKAWQHELDYHREQLAAQGIKYLLVIAPDKETTCSQELPHWMDQILPYSQTDEFLTFMRLHSSVEILDLREPLREASRRAPLFYKSDTHWNLLGVAVAEKSICPKLRELLLGPERFAPADFGLLPASGTGGNISRIAALPYRLDPNFYRFASGTNEPAQKFYSTTDEIEPEQFGLLPVPQIMAIHATNQVHQLKAIVFGDSFSFALTPFLAAHFKELHVLRRNFDMGEVNRVKPDIVIEERSEGVLWNIFPGR